MQLQADPWGLCMAASALIKPLGLGLPCHEGFMGAGKAGGGLWEQEEEEGEGVCASRTRNSDGAVASG